MNKQFKSWLKDFNLFGVILPIKLGISSNEVKKINGI